MRINFNQLNWAIILIYNQNYKLISFARYLGFKKHRNKASATIQKFILQIFIFFAWMDSKLFKTLGIKGVFVPSTNHLCLLWSFIMITSLKYLVEFIKTLLPTAAIFFFRGYHGRNWEKLTTMTSRIYNVYLKVCLPLIDAQ